MPEWIKLPTAPFYSQPVQLALLHDRRIRVCTRCGREYNTKDADICASCKVKGVRKFDRFTVIAGRRFGKTKVGSIIGAEEATVSNSIGWACAPTNDKLHRYVIPAFQELIPQEWVKSWSAEHWDLRLKNDALIHFQTLEHPDQGRGQGLDWLWIDEVSELTRMHWDVIRPSLVGDTAAYFTTSPRGYDWVYEELYEPALHGIPGYWAARAKTVESANPRITREFLDRERQLMSDTMYRQEYEGDFVTFTGSVYGDLLTPQILRTREQIQKVIPEWPDIAKWRQVLVGIDTGADHPFGAVKIISTERGLVVVGDYLERDKPFAIHCGNLHRLAANPNTKWAINKNERQAVWELAQHGIYVQKSENDVIAGTERVKSWLHTHQLWFVEDLCPRTINQMRAYRYAENKSPKDDQKRKERVFKLNDELPDCLRYALMTWPKLPSAPPAEKPRFRDISHLSEGDQWTIKKLRELEGRRVNTTVQGVGEFYTDGFTGEGDRQKRLEDYDTGERKLNAGMGEFL